MTPVKIIPRGKSLSIPITEVMRKWEQTSLKINPLKMEHLPRAIMGTLICHLKPPEDKPEGPSEVLLKTAKFIIFTL